MSAKKNKNQDYRTLSSSTAGGAKKNGSTGDTPGLSPGPARKKEDELLRPLSNRLRKNVTTGPAGNPEPPSPQSSPGKTGGTVPVPVQSESSGILDEPLTRENFSAGAGAAEEAEGSDRAELSYSERRKLDRKQKAVEKDHRLLAGDRWLARNGHTVTYVGIFLFTLVVYFRPYELIPALSGFTSIALICALATLLVFLPTQFSTEGNLTSLPTEVKCVLFLAAWALLTIPIAKEPGRAWETYNDTFIKVILIFVVMVNTLRTKKRLKGLMWLSIGVGVMLSYQAVDLYRRGEFEVEGYRVSVDFGGMFGNPNDMAIHLVIFTPIAAALGMASKSLFSKAVYFTSALIMVGGNMVTQSRGGFLGLLATAGIMVWKLAKKQRLQVFAVSAVLGVALVAFAPGNYGTRILSIFIPELDQVGSSDQRKELLIQSVIVTLRNPLGIGIGNFPVVGAHNLETHNSYTQVSSELGWLALAAYLIFIISPFRKLGAIERQIFARGDFSWVYYLSVGLQASIVGYMVSSFFGAVAYNWYIYYPIAYAVCLRRIYRLTQGAEATPLPAATGGDNLDGYFKIQKV